MGELLVEFTILLNVHGPLLLAVPGEAVQVTGHSVAQILGIVDPREVISIQNKRSWYEAKIFSGKHNTFGFASLWFWMCAERNLMILDISLS